MDQEARTRINWVISAAGDAVVFSFGQYCMALLEELGTVTAEDAYAFARDRGLL